jgi:hypothetical protein
MRPGDAEDFAAEGIEGDILDTITGVEIADGEGDGAAGAAGGEVGGAELTADHESHDVVDGKFRCEAGGDQMSVAKDADAVGDLLDFFETVGDVEDGDTLGLELAD